MTGKSGPIRAVRGRVKAKRWAKGQSSSSNPTTHRHRQLAKSRMLSSGTGPSTGNLTESALKAHNEAEIAVAIEDDRVTVGSIKDEVLSGSFYIPAFDRFLSKFSVQSNMHKQMLAILAAVRDIIKDSNAKESETGYFAALILALSSLETADELAAAITLVNTIIRRVPKSVLKLKFGEFSKTLEDLLTQHLTNEHNVLIGQLISCLGYLLQVQDDGEWQHSSTQLILNKILHFITNSQPKIRRSARLTVHLIISADGRQTHPARKHVASYCNEKLESYSGPKSTQQILHVLNLLKEVLMLFPRQDLKQTSEKMFGLMKPGNITMNNCLLLTFRALFCGLPMSENLPASLTCQMMNALHHFFPVLGDSALMPNWLAVMEAASVYLHNIEPNLAWDMLPHLFEKARAGWLSNSSEVQQAATSTLKALLYKTLEPLKETTNVPPATLKSVERLFKIIKDGLKLQYRAVWDQVLHILAVFFETAGSFGSGFMKECLQEMASGRDSHYSAYVNKLDYAIGKAVQSMGPDAVLSAIPLTIVEAERIDVGCPNNWLVPILRDNISNSTLAFFNAYFLPRANSCESVAKKLRSEEKIEAASDYEQLHAQLWSCLPGFCNSPSDLAQNFRIVAKTLGESLNHQPELRLDIMAALRSVINCNLDNEVNKSKLAGFSKNYLPILLNLYTTKSDSENHVRLAVLETIVVYLQITPSQLCDELFDKLLSKLGDDNGTTDFMKQAVLDVSRVMVAYVDYNRVDKLYNVALQHMESYDRTVVKKCFRVFHEICLGKSKACQDYVGNNWSGFKELFSSLSDGAPAVKAIKLNGLSSIIKFIPKKKMITTLVPKIISCVCENSHKAKDAAFNLLETILQHFIGKHGQDEEVTLQNFVGIMMSALGDSSAMIGATVASVGFIIKTFDEHVTDELLKNVLEKACLLLEADDRAVMRASLDFLIAVMPIVRDDILVGHLKEIVENTLSMPEIVRKPLQTKIRQLFTKLIKRFGRALVAKHVPEKHARLITNLHKVIERKKRQQMSKALLNQEHKHGNKDLAERKSIAELLEDSDSGDDEDDNKNTKKLITCIRERTDESIINFLDPSSSQHIRSLPVNQQGKGSKEHFPVAADGRLIIGDDDDEEEEEEEAENDEGLQSDKDDSLLGEEISFGENLKKRKLSEMEDDERLDTKSSSSAVQSTAPQIGIHRNLASKPTGDVHSGSKYKSKKAKGDVKKPGQPDPYAYIPLDRRILSKRKSNDKYKHLLRAARKGAKKGTKQRAHLAKN